MPKELKATIWVMLGLAVGTWAAVTFIIALGWYIEWLGRVLGWKG